MEKDTENQRQIVKQKGQRKVDYSSNRLKGSMLYMRAIRILFCGVEYFPVGACKVRQHTHFMLGCYVVPCMVVI